MLRESKQSFCPPSRFLTALPLKNARELAIAAGTEPRLGGKSFLPVLESGAENRAKIALLHPGLASVNVTVVSCISKLRAFDLGQ
jgi:hypothetical protein